MKNGSLLRLIFIKIIAIGFFCYGCTPMHKSVRVESIPPKADIWVKGDPVGLFTPADVPITYDKENPKVEIRVEKVGFKPEKKFLVYKDIPRDFTIPFTLKEDKKQSLIDSSPKGAEIIVDGKSKGATPSSIEFSFVNPETNEPRDIVIEIKKEGFKPDKKILNYSNIKEITFFELIADKKQFLLDSVPQDAEVFIDDAKKGSTPLNIELSFIDPETKGLREVTIKVKKDGYETPDGKDAHVEVLSYHDPRKTLNIPFNKIKEIETVVHEIKEGVVAGMIKLVLEEKKVIAELDVIERSPNVKSVTRVTSFQGKVEVSAPLISPDGKTLISSAMVVEKAEKEKLLSPSYFESLYLEGRQVEASPMPKLSPAYLWSLNLEGGTGVTTITYAKGIFGDIDPAFSPDGRYIYFASDREGDILNLWRIKTTGAGGLTKMTATKASDREPWISPDGTMLSFSSLPLNAELRQVWTVNANGFLPTQLREGHSPKWSPDGKLILYTLKDKVSGRVGIWVMNADGSNPTQLTFGIDADDIHPQWSPDGKKIIFASNRGLDSKKRPNFDIWVMNADGSELTQLTTNGSLDDYPTWDPTGKYIYFRSNRGGNLEIWRVELSQMEREATSY